MSPAPMSIAHELASLQGAEVLVLGDILLDRYIAGEVQRVSPEAPVPVVLERERRVTLGGAANVAANVAALGARATLIGRIGDDDEGREVVRLLDDLGVDHHLVVTPGSPTATKVRVLASGQQIVRIDNELVTSTVPEEHPAILDQVDRFLSGGPGRALVLADYAKGFLANQLIGAVIDAARRSNVPVVTDPKGRDLSRYSGSTVIKPNLAEARDASGALDAGPPNSGEEISALATSTLAASAADNVVLSCSSAGVAVVGSSSPDLVRFDARAREVADVSGAGDTLVALTALGLAAALPLLRAVEIANLAAGAVCGKVGTATLTATELLAVTGADAGSHPTGRSAKVLAGREEAARIGAQYADEDRRLVFANGCFDLLHAGHVHLLERARSLGDALMVALNTDASVRRLKESGRPIQSEDDRCEIMAALACVDFVVLFDEDTPLDLINAVRPRVLVKGDDYEADAVVGAREVTGWGGEVALVARLDGRSTTRIVEAGRPDGSSGPAPAE
jgi:D-beta-D-heptose 7-phosphate kinase / D-beta-D-heptose 1-phosphate adenosyltransferase